MINNKKVFLIYIVCFFLFLTFYIFPNYSVKPRLFAFYLKDTLENPLRILSINSGNYLKLLKSNDELLIELNNLKKENDYLRNINNYFKVLSSKYIDQYQVFHESSPPIPLSIGVSVIGDRNLIYNKDFVINKGLGSGIQISDYVVDGVDIIGRVKSVNSNSSLVVTVKSIDYGDEIFIDNKSYIVSGTNNDYLSFLRQKNSINKINLNLGQKAIVQRNNVNLILGRVFFIDDQPVIKTKTNINLDNLRVLIND